MQVSTNKYKSISLLALSEGFMQYGVSLVGSNSPEHGLMLRQSVWFQVADDVKIHKLPQQSFLRLQLEACSMLHSHMWHHKSTKGVSGGRHREVGTRAIWERFRG